ncbi:MAG: septation protein A [Pseudomonadota bacterium]
MHIQETEETKIPPALKLLLELGPVACFVVAYTQGERIVEWFGITGILEQPIMLATAVIMVTTALAIGGSLWLTKSVPAMPIVTLVVVTIFGGLTLWFADETFIKMKPTIVNTLFGAVLLIGLYFGKSFLKTVMGMAFAIDDEGWMKLTLRWGLFFLFLAVVNEIVWRNFSEAFWVGFKFWGMTGLTFLFVLSQTPLLMKHSTEKEEG